MSNRAGGPAKVLPNNLSLLALKVVSLDNHGAGSWWQQFLRRQEAAVPRLVGQPAAGVAHLPAGQALYLGSLLTF